MDANKKIFNDFAEQLVQELKGVSGRFSDSIEYEITESQLGLKMVISASPYIMVLVDGRKPTRVGAQKGNPTLQQIILEWIKDKGITPRPTKNGRIMTVESLSWAISQSIHNYGTLLYQRGGGNNIFDPIINDARLNSLFALFEKNQFKTVESIIIKRQKK